METVAIVAALLFSLFAVTILVIRRQRNFSQLPGASVLEYLPGGLLHPLLKDPRNFANVIYSLSSRYGRTFTAQIGMARVVLSSHPADILQIISSPQFWRPAAVTELWRLIMPGGIISLNQDEHKAARRTLRGRFNFELIQSFENEMFAVVSEMCDNLASDARPPASGPETGKVIDLAALMSITTFRVITNVAFGSGMDKKQRTEFAATAAVYMDEMMNEYISYPIRKYLAPFGARKKLLASKHKIDGMCREFIDRRVAEDDQQRAERRPDILDVFLELDSANSIATVSRVVEFAIAGSHSTAQILAWSVLETCKNEQIVRQIENELSSVLENRPWSEPITLNDLQKLAYIHKIWKETLRLHPVIMVTDRVAVKNVKLNGSGVEIPAGTSVMALWGVSHLSPDAWVDPMVFKPERWGFGDEYGEGDKVQAGYYVPFGIGRLSCAGKFLTEYEGPLLLAEMHRRFRFELACKPEEIFNSSSFVQCPKYASVPGGDFDMGLPVRVELRQSPSAVN